MHTYSLLDKLCFKFFIIFLVVNAIFEQDFNKKEVNDLENYFSQSICQLIYFTLNYNCTNNFISNNNFYNDILEINGNSNLLINIKKSILENIFLLFSIIPFLKNNSTLSYKINNKGIYKLLKRTLNKKIKYKIIKLDYNDLHPFNKKVKKLLYYKWKLIPKQFMLDNLRHIFNNYYNKESLVAFEKSLNMNYKSYIHNKKFEIAYEEIKNLLSKLIINNFIYNKKILEYIKKRNV